MKNKLLALDNLNLYIDGLHILQNISFSIHEGEIITVIGPNGSGKSSLLKTLVGLNKNSANNVIIAPQTIIGYMPQFITLNQNLPIKVKDFLSLSVDKAVNKKTVNEIIDFVGIRKLVNTPMQKLSGGEKQFVLLAKALIKQPNLLILDEPTQGIDVKRQSEFYALIEELRSKKNIACLIVSHDLHMVMKTTDYVICLNHHICCQGPVTKIEQNAEFQDLFSHDSLHSFSLYRHNHDHSH
jgi:zinc transport system ATP-binding protein